MAQGPNRGPLAGAQMKQIQGEIFRFWVPLLLSDRDPNRKVNFVGDNTVEISDKQGNRTRLLVDESGIPQKLMYELVPMQGTPAAVENLFSDIKEVDGIKLPFKIAMTQDGRKVADVTVEEYKLNQGLKQEDVGKLP